MEQKISILTVTYNSAAVIGPLLDSLAGALEGLNDHEVVVVDNQSADASVAIARGHPIGVRIVETGGNAGYAAGINAGMAAIADARHVLILNADIRLDTSAIRMLLDRLSDRLVGVAVPKMLDEDGALSPSIRREPSIVTAWADSLLGGALATRLGVGEIVEASAIYETGGAVEWATGAALLVSAETRRRVGVWDESFFLYSEEVDYMRRVREAGLTIAFVPAARCVHIGGECKVRPNLFALLTANRIRYYRRHHGPLSSAVFRLGVIAGEAMRAIRGPEHRAALKSAVVAAS